ncbi:hypothetical protein CHARACLAT_027938 [Characodon lateralis]|uniref:Uncharacterized protein n=1 Tax=Characodon lateralis TaxID=208331 RepID=A0ABU7CV92_9TELE|nr:hypothetical protein [Characodon lateralis]
MSSSLLCFSNFLGYAAFPSSSSLGIVFFHLLPVEGATAEHLIPTIFFCNTNPSQILFRSVHDHSLCSFSFPPPWKLHILCPRSPHSFLCTCPKHLSLTTLSPPNNTASAPPPDAAHKTGGFTTIL